VPVPVGGSWVFIATDANVIESISGTHGFRNSLQHIRRSRIYWG